MFTLTCVFICVFSPLCLVLLQCTLALLLESVSHMHFQVGLQSFFTIPNGLLFPLLVFVFFFSFRIVMYILTFPPIFAFIEIYFWTIYFRECDLDSSCKYCGWQELNKWSSDVYIYYFLIRSKILNKWPCAIMDQFDKLLLFPSTIFLDWRLHQCLLLRVYSHMWVCWSAVVFSLCSWQHWQHLPSES